MYNTTKKRTVIGAFYPAKLMYDGTQHRTARPNEIILNISLINKKLPAKKTGQKMNFHLCPVPWYQLGSNQRHKDFQSLLNWYDMHQNVLIYS
jgi:hypothetical protein